MLAVPWEVNPSEGQSSAETYGMDGSMSYVGGGGYESGQSSQAHAGGGGYESG